MLIQESAWATCQQASMYGDEGLHNIIRHARTEVSRFNNCITANKKLHRYNWFLKRCYIHFVTVCLFIIHNIYHNY